MWHSSPGWVSAIDGARRSQRSTHCLLYILIIIDVCYQYHHPLSYWPRSYWPRLYWPLVQITHSFTALYQLVCISRLFGQLYFSWYFNMTGGSGISGQFDTVDKYTRAICFWFYSSLVPPFLMLWDNMSLQMHARVRRGGDELPA